MNYFYKSFKFLAAFGTRCLLVAVGAGTPSSSVLVWDGAVECPAHECLLGLLKFNNGDLDTPAHTIGGAVRVCAPQYLFFGFGHITSFARHHRPG